jgi:hypothetical protein
LNLDEISSKEIQNSLTAVADVISEIFSKWYYQKPMISVYKKTNLCILVFFLFILYTVKQKKNILCVRAHDKWNNQTSFISYSIIIILRIIIIIIMWSNTLFVIFIITINQTFNQIIHLMQHHKHILPSHFTNLWLHTPSWWKPCVYGNISVTRPYAYCDFQLFLFYKFSELLRTVES